MLTTNNRIANEPESLRDNTTEDTIGKSAGEAFCSEKVLCLKYESLPSARELVSLALMATDERSIRLFTSAEEEIFRAFNSYEFALIEATKNGLAVGPLEPTTDTQRIASLKLLSGLLGPLDHTLFATKAGVTDEWITSREQKLISIADKLGKHDVTIIAQAELFDRAVAMKAGALRILSNLALPAHEIQSVKAVKTSDKRFGYAALYREILGDNLCGVAAYGGSLTASSPTELRDYDNIICVRDVSEAMGLLRDRHLFWDGVPVHTQIVPLDVFVPFLLMAYAPSFNQNTLRVIEGELNVPVVSHNTILLMGLNGVVGNVMDKRTSLLSKMIRDAHIFIERVKLDDSSIALSEAFSTIILAQLGWWRQFAVKDQGPRRAKRKAAELLLNDYGIDPLPTILGSAEEMKAGSVQEVQYALAQSIVTLHQAMAATLSDPRICLAT